jgi:hypothetical protein
MTVKSTATATHSERTIGRELMTANNNGWTDERRAKQSAMIHSWKPWTQSTGARTQQGKDNSKMNARRVTMTGLYRRACKLCYYRQQFFKGGYMPYHLIDSFEAFKIENDDWLENAPMKKKAPKT